MSKPGKDDSVRKPGRREFLKAGGVATAALLTPATWSETTRTMAPLPSNPVTQGAMPTRNLGRTGYKVGVFSRRAGRA